MNDLRRPLINSAVALAATAAALFVRWLLTPLLEHRLPYITLYGAVAIAVWYGGWGPALLATALGLVGAQLAFVEPEPGAPLSMTGIGGLAGMAAYLLSCLLVISLGNGMRQARRRAEAAALEALANQKRLEGEMAEHRRTEEALRQKEAELELIASRTPLLLTRCSADLRFLYVNQACAEFLGRQPDDVIGRPIAAVLGEAALAAIAPHIERVLRGERVEFEMAVPYTRPGRRFIHATYSPDRDPDGRVMGWLASIVDITERKQAEVALAEANQRKDEFLATLAHELRNPLAPVRNAIQLLRFKGPPAPELDWARDVIDRQVQQMTRLIDDLMDISRITRNRLELRKERTDLARVLQGAVETSRPLIDGAGHSLTITLPPEPIFLDLDITRMAQVFANVLNNAAKYTDRGGRIWLTAERQGSDAVISVRDTGIGIPLEKLSSIFEPFTQVSASPEQSRGGLGIGLTLVKRLVDMHGGSVTAHSDGPGRGSELTVRLPIPIASPPSDAPPATDEGPTWAPGRARVLIVDDNNDAATSLAMLLSILGYETRTAGDGPAGLEALAAFLPDVVLLDIGMPGMSGYEVAQRIRQQPGGGDLVLIAVTGWGQAEDRRRTLEAGFDHHLVKPVDPPALTRLLASVLAARQASG